MANKRGRPINATLNAENIEKLRNWVNGVKYGIHQSTAEKRIHELAMRTEEEFKRTVADRILYPAYSTGDLVSHCEANVKRIGRKGEGFKIIIKNTSPDYKYFEYGTGVIGEDSPHYKAAEIGWEYNVSGRGPDEKWLVITPNGSFRTAGQMPSYALYDTYKWCQTAYPSEIAKCIRMRRPTLKRK